MPPSSSVRSRRRMTSRWSSCRHSWPSAARRSVSGRCGGSSIVTGSRVKKDRARRRTGAPPRPEASRGVVRGATRPRSRAAGLDRRNLGIDEHGASPWTLPTGRAAALERPARALEDHDVHRGPAPFRHGRADGARRPDQPRRLCRLCPPGARARPLAGRHRHHGQSIEPQSAGRSRGDRSRRRDTAVPPALQPDFNPIEQAFSKLKAHLRKAAERTVHGLWGAIGRILDLYSPQECAKSFTNAGYDAD